MLELKVSVTAEDIAKARAMQEAGKFYMPCHSCPIAQAIKRQGHGQDYVSCSLTTVFVGNSVYQLPDIARQFVHNFDARNTVSPIEFTAEVITNGQ